METLSVPEFLFFAAVIILSQIELLP